MKTCFAPVYYFSPQQSDVLCARLSPLEQVVRGESRVVTYLCRSAAASLTHHSLLLIPSPLVETQNCNFLVQQHSAVLRFTHPSSNGGAAAIQSELGNCRTGRTTCFCPGEGCDSPSWQRGSNSQVISAVTAKRSQ